MLSAMDTQCISSSPLDLEDIEDLFNDGSEDVNAIRRKNRQNIVIPKVKKKLKESKLEFKPAKAARPYTETSFLPGRNTIYIRTWGCAHNSSDSEYMAGQLVAQGYSLTEDKKMADLWILNSCTVKNPSETHFRNEVDQGLAEGRKVVVSGCVPQGKPDADYVRGLSVIGVQQIDRVVEVVEETLKGNQVRLLGAKRVQVIDSDEVGRDKSVRRGGGASLDLPKVRRNPLVEIIAINTGCLNQCTYCKTKHARGVLGSYPIDEIVARAKQSFEEGVIELWLTSEDTGAYGRDIGVTLPDLLRQLVQIVPENCRLRLGMTNPPYILDHLDEMAEILNHPRVYKFLHVPVQSGSDAVLFDMRREYVRNDFCKVVDVLRQKVQGINIATDIICGFPTETEEDFEDTMMLCQKYRFPSLFVNQFYSRPGTVAAKMKPLPTQVTKQRTKALTDFFYSYEPYKDRLGTRYSALVTDISHDKNHYVGHNESYDQILLPKKEELMGKIVQVEIVSASKFSMVGKIIDGSVQRPTNYEVLKKGQVSGVQFGAAGRCDDAPTRFIFKWSFLLFVVILIVRMAQFVL